MAMKLNPGFAGVGYIRDKQYPSEVAAERPRLSTRIFCEDAPDHMDPNESRAGAMSDDRYKEFNEQLRSGLGVGRPFLQDGPNEE